MDVGAIGSDATHKGAFGETGVAIENLLQVSMKITEEMGPFLLVHFSLCTNGPKGAASPFVSNRGSFCSEKCEREYELHVGQIEPAWYAFCFSWNPCPTFLVLANLEAQNMNQA